MNIVPSPESGRRLKFSNFRVCSREKLDRTVNYIRRSPDQMYIIHSCSGPPATKVKFGINCTRYEYRIQITAGARIRFVYTSVNRFHPKSFFYPTKTLLNALPNIVSVDESQKRIVLSSLVQPFSRGKSRIIGVAVPDPTCTRGIIFE